MSVNVILWSELALLVRNPYEGGARVLPSPNLPLFLSRMASYLYLARSAISKSPSPPKSTGLSYK